MVDLGGFGGTCTLATAINNQGQVVGESYRTGDQSAPAFLWENGSIHELVGSFGGDFSGAFAVNDQGEAAGFGYLSGNSTFHAALWKNVKSIADLGVIGSDTCSYAAAINAGGQVVGSSSPICDFDEARAFLWQDGTLFDLNSLIPPASALYLKLTYAINNRGEIAGTGVDASGNDHAFLVVPCDENHPGVEGCDYSLVDSSTPLAAPPVPASVAVPSIRPTPRLPSLLRGTDRGRQPFSSMRAIPDQSPERQSQSVAGDRLADVLLDSPISPNIRGLRGYCLVDSQTDKLTGGCVAPTVWFCLSGHSSACPAGAEALKPQQAGCGLLGSPTVDVSRTCSF